MLRNKLCCYGHLLLCPHFNVRIYYVTAELQRTGEIGKGRKDLRSSSLSLYCLRFIKMKRTRVHKMVLQPNNLGTAMFNFNKVLSSSQYNKSVLLTSKRHQLFFFFIWNCLEILNPKKISPLPQSYSVAAKKALSFMPFELVKCN